VKLDRLASLVGRAAEDLELRRVVARVTEEDEGVCARGHPGYGDLDVTRAGVEAIGENDCTRVSRNGCELCLRLTRGDQAIRAQADAELVTDLLRDVRDIPGNIVRLGER
jgi:hypothetical protein